jgi:RNA-directed DNA polymerase
MATVASSPITSLAGVNTRADVAALLSTSTNQLQFLLYARPPGQRYTRFAISKRRGGTRTILAQREDLKVLQMKLAGRLGELYRPRQVVYGFIEGRSIVGNADRHVRCRHVLNVDLKDFFPSIHIGRVIGMFKRHGAGQEAATVLAQIACHDGALPQGSPASPVISNLICSKMDRQLLELAKQYRCTYTRYADDLTFSRKQGAFPAELARNDEEEGRAILGAELRGIIEVNSFAPHPEKTWLFSGLHRQSVTGLVVNRKRNVPREFVRQVRGMINAWAKHGLERAQETYHAEHWFGQQGDEPPDFRLVVLGKMEFLKMVKGPRDGVYRRLQQRLVKVDDTYFDVMEKENMEMDKRDVFISHASEDKDGFVRPLTELLIKKGLSVWYDEYDISIGDSILEQINYGLRVSRFGVVVLSPNFFAARKTWTNRELDGLTAAEDVDKQKRILPIWPNISKAQLVAKRATLAGLAAGVTANESLEQIADKIVRKVNKAKAGEADEEEGR